MKTVRTLKDYFTGRYGHAIQRIPLDLGLSCPHRDPKGRGGCAFCSAEGSRAQHLHDGMTLEEQVRRGVEYVRVRYHADPPYAAYFKAFTSTNAPAETLREIYRRALSLAPFNTVIIATRPDCLPPETVAVIAELTEQ